MKLENRTVGKDFNLQFRRKVSIRKLEPWGNDRVNALYPKSRYLTTTYPIYLTSSQFARCAHRGVCFGLMFANVAGALVVPLPSPTPPRKTHERNIALNRWFNVFVRWKRLDTR